MCEKLHTLPRAGGLFDQDSLFVYVMEHYQVAVNEREQIDNKRSGRGGRKYQGGISPFEGT